MSHCMSCGKIVNDEYLFCLTCGRLRFDYENVKLDSLDYTLTGEEFMMQVANQFSDVSSRYFNLMDDFSQSVENYRRKMDDISKESQFAIFRERVKRMSDVFEGLTGLFDDILISLSDIVFEELALLNILLKNADGELKDSYETSQNKLIDSFKGLIDSAKDSRSSFASITIAYPNENFDVAKENLLLRFDRFVIFHESFIRELKFIKDKYLNNNSMSSEDNHNHFCIYCGARINGNENFCSECGKPIYKEKPKAPEEPVIKKAPSEYESKITKLEQEYNIKQKKASELVEKLFDPDHFAYERFTSSITKSNNLFSIQVDIARKMDEMDASENPFVVRELDAKMTTLETFIDKMEDLTNELIIHMSSNKKDNDDINNLFNDMDDLIDSVKDY